MYSDFLSFYRMPFSVPGPHLAHSTKFSRHFSLGSSSVTVSSPFLISDDLHGSEDSGLVFCRMTI